MVQAAEKWEQEEHRNVNTDMQGLKLTGPPFHPFHCFCGKSLLGGS